MSRIALIAVSLSVVGGCSRPTIPDPEPAARAYAEAAKRGDADAIHALLTSDALRTYGKQGVRRLVQDTRRELKRRGEALASKQTTTRTDAVVRFADGEEAELVVQEGELRVSAAGALPTGARTPAQALAELRQALARRSYAGLMRVLSTESRSALEGDMRSLVSGLEHPDTLDVKVTGDTARVEVPGGHWVTLKREAGVWRVEDFD
jgi:hypothetical protein